MPSPDGRLHYAFVGAFRDSALDGAVGGQLHACRTLMASPITSQVSFSTIDSTMVSVPPPPLRRRVGAAAKRFGRFSRLVSRTDVDGALIFSSAGASLVEKSAMVMVARAFGKRVVLSPRSGLIKDDLRRRPRLAEPLSHVLRACDVVLCQGEHWRTFFEEIGGPPSERYVVVPNWLELLRYPDGNETRRARSGAPTFLYMGWLEPYKGILDLIQAVAHATDDLAESRFIVCGKGSLDNVARDRAAKLGVAERFDFRGWVTGDEKAKTLLEADVLVLPSHREGMPNALLEAMASGLAVVACDVGGVPDVVCRPSLGKLVSPRDPEVLGDALVEMAQDREARLAMGDAARAHIVEHHDIEALWPRILDALRGASKGDLQ